MTPSGTIDERYLTWLFGLLEPTTQSNPARSHWNLCKHMYKIEFSWFIPNDDNRIYDGLDLRQEFVDEEEGGDLTGIEAWFSEPCSFLEMVIALGRRMAFEAGQEPDYWFWTMMENLGFRIYVDDQWDGQVEMLVSDIVNGVVNRTYRADGSEGLFPLRHPGHDQRGVELWYQQSQWLLENIVV